MWTGNMNVPLPIAKNLYLNGQQDQAFSILRRTRGSNARMVEGELLMYSGKLRKAMSIFSAAADRSATRSAALNNLALCHYLQGNMDAAIDTIIVGAAIYPSSMSLMTLFSRLVRTRDEIDRYLTEKARLAKRGLSTGCSAQLIRACGRVGARSKAEGIASDAIINMCAVSNVNDSAVEQRRRTETGLLRGQYSSKKGDVILEHISEIMQQARVRLFLMGGTLLGLIRDKRLLSWDKDLDFGCFAEEVSISNLWSLFSDSPYFIPMGVVEDRLIKLRHISGVTVDIFVNFLEGDVRWHGGQFVFWRDNAFSLKQIKLRAQHFYVPEDPEAYLTNHYGKTWDRKDPHFDVFWEAPDAFDPNIEHRYANTLAKGVQFLAAGALDIIKMRRDRAKKGGADDVAEAYQYVLDLYEEFRVL
jgi:tetratricopeptide (TPR) repeat protein